MSFRICLQFGRDEPLNPNIQRTQSEADRLVEVLNFTQDVLDKKYGLYQWCEMKINTLVVLDGLLLGGVYVVIDKFGKIDGFFELAMLGLAGFFLFGSLLISLFHIKPAMNSKRTSERNIRTVIGTEAYRTLNEYSAQFADLTPRDVIQLNIEQAYGMNKNIMRSQRAIKIGVWMAVCGIIPLIGFIGSWAFSKLDPIFVAKVHLLTSWPWF